jgi:hypothetical protein
MRRTGFSLALIGVIVYALASVLLDYYRGGPGGDDVGITYFGLFRQLGSAPAVLSMSAAILYVFGGPLLIAGLCVAGLRDGPPSAIRAATIGAAAVWVLFVLGLSLRVLASRDQVTVDVGIGFWVQLASAALVAIGGAVLLPGPSSVSVEPSTEHLGPAERDPVDPGPTP